MPLLGLLANSVIISVDTLRPAYSHVAFPYSVIDVFWGKDHQNRSGLCRVPQQCRVISTPMSSSYR